MNELEAPLGSPERTAQLVRQAAALGITPAATPTSADQVQSSPVVQTPDTKMKVAGVAPVVAAVDGIKTSLDLQQQQEADRANAAKTQADLLLREQANAKKSVLDIFNTTPTASDSRSQAFADIGVDPQSYFADQRERISRIDSLNKDYADTKAKWERAEEARRTAGGGLTSGTDTALKAMERDKSIELNRKSAYINSEAAVLQALQGNFNEARSFANQAVEDATADRRYKVDTIEEFYKMNQDSISRLDKQYQDALDASRTLARDEYEGARADAKYAMELSLKYPNAGIKVTDSPEVATGKARPFAGSESSSFTNTQLNSGAANAGLPVGDFKTFPAEIQNFYINLTNAQQTELNDSFNNIKSGDESLEEVEDKIKNLVATPAVKDHLLAKARIAEAERNVKQGQTPGRWEKVKSWLGI